MTRTNILNRVPPTGRDTSVSHLLRVFPVLHRIQTLLHEPLSKRQPRTIVGHGHGIAPKSIQILSMCRCDTRCIPKNKVTLSRSYTIGLCKLQKGEGGGRGVWKFCAKKKNIYIYREREHTRTTGLRISTPERPIPENMVTTKSKQIQSH